MDILKQAWYLRTHPFSPTCDPFGENLAFDTSRSLDPLGLDQLLHLYFDVYKWDQSSEIRQLSQKDGLGRFPNLDSLVENNDTQVVIVSGRDLSGVRSMVNLIKFKAEQNSSKTPLMFSGRLNLQSKDGWAKTIIKFFNDRYRSVEPQPPYQVLKEIYDEEVAELKDNPAGYLNLPQRIQHMVRSVSNRPIVFTMDLNENFIYEHWTTIYEIVYGLVNLFIIPTRSPINASSFYRSKHAETQVVHIEACKLNLEKAREYLTQRLKLYRINNGFSGIAPFSDDALSRLFEHGSNATNSSPVTFPIGWLNKRLKTAVDKQIQILAEYSQENDITESAPIPQQMIMIQQDLMEQLIIELNHGTVYRGE